MAATGVLLLANPLVKHVGGWMALDEWPCRGLDRVEKAVPIISLPAEKRIPLHQIVRMTRNIVLATSAGDNLRAPNPVGGFSHPLIFAHGRSDSYYQQGTEAQSSDARVTHITTGKEYCYSCSSRLLPY
ncbi:hypothetical protein O3P69_007699 [Scylla paramamosain]|uniref:Uncharacterized protein n=1 Tax=Scylla paramamosain TaxID=85552 RepID=A0AAW0UYH7_SCYPA